MSLKGTFASLPRTFSSVKPAICQEFHGVSKTALLCQQPLTSMCSRTHSLYLQFHFFFSLPLSPCLLSVLPSHIVLPRWTVHVDFLLCKTSCSSTLIMAEPFKCLFFVFIFTAGYHLANQVEQFPLSCVGMSRWVLGSHFTLTSTCLFNPYPTAFPYGNAVG